MAYASAPGDLTLHGVRVLGFPSASRIASRYGLDADAVAEALLDFEAYGWVSRTSFAGSSGWSLTAAGRAENEARLAAELDEAGARPAVTRAHAVAGAARVATRHGFPDHKQVNSDAILTEIRAECGHAPAGGLPSPAKRPLRDADWEPEQVGLMPTVYRWDTDR